MKTTVIGGANVDVSARPEADFRLRDSNPGLVSVAFGGVARNIAHNLCLMGAATSFVTVFGDDFFGQNLMADCRKIGMDLSLSEQIANCRSNFYVCLNDDSGDMLSAVADTASMAHITPEFLAKRIDQINAHDLVVIDTNLEEAALIYLLDNVRVPLFIDAVSTAKTLRLKRAMEQSRRKHISLLKLNRLEAEAMTETTEFSELAGRLHVLGAEKICITLGGDGVLCSDGKKQKILPAIPTKIVNTTGAGDAFLAGVAFGFLKKCDFFDAAKIGLDAAHQTLQCENAVNEKLTMTIDYD